MPRHGVFEEAALVILKKPLIFRPRWRGKAGTRDQHPPYHTEPYFRNPSPCPNHSRNSQPVTVFVFKANLAESTGVVQGWGFGELSRRTTQTHPTLVKAGLSPRMWGWTVSETFAKIGWVGVMDGYWLSRPRLPWVCCLPPFPLTHPPRIILHLISGHPRQGTSHPETWCRMTQAQRGSGCLPFRRAGMRRFWPPLPSALGSCRAGGGRRRRPLFS